MESDQNFWSMLFGPYGGASAIGFGAGCAATWGFMERVVYRERVKQLEARISSLESKAIEYDKLMKGLAAAQLAKLEHGNAGP